MRWRLVVWMCLVSATGRGTSLGIDYTFSSARDVTMGLWGIVEPFSGVLLSVASQLQLVPRGADSLQGQLGLGIELATWLVGSLTVSGSRHGADLYGIGAGLSLEWKLGAATLLTTGADATRYTLRLGDEAWQQGLHAGIAQGLGERLSLAVNYSHFLYADETGFVNDIPSLLDGVRDRRLASFIAAMPYNLFSASIGMALSPSWRIDGELSSLSVADTSGRIPGAGLSVSYNSDNGYSCGIHAKAAWLDGRLLSSQGGISLGLSW